VVSKNKELNYESLQGVETYDGPPYLFNVYFDKNSGPVTMSGFDKKHIINQTKPKKPIKIVKIKEKNQKILDLVSAVGEWH
jgi:hypothetical protein